MKVTTKKQMYDADQFAVERLGIEGKILMENAGANIAARIRSKKLEASKVVVLCGGGNNGGDGIVVARYLQNWGVATKLYLVPLQEKIRGDARVHLEIYQKHGYPVYSIAQDTFDAIARADIIIDALLGIGMEGELKPPYDALISACNQATGKIISIDIPSGVSANGGVASGAIKADYTYTIAYEKQSVYLYPAAEHYGITHIVDIGIPASAVVSNVSTWEAEEFVDTRPSRAPNAHKGNCGNILIIGGSRWYRSAPLISARGCVTCGAGRLHLAAPECTRQSVPSFVPEATFCDCNETDGYLTGIALPDHMDVIAFGMGLSREEGGQEMLKQVLKATCPVLIDADGLFFLAQNLEWLQQRTAPTALTPHAGEMAKLCQCDVEYVNQNRFAVAKEFATKWGVYLALKGPYTIVTTPQGEQFVNTSGNAGLAKGGAGDLLTGMAAAFMAATQNVQVALSNAVFAHGLTADYLLEDGHSLLDISFTDMIEALPQVLRVPKLAEN